LWLTLDKINNSFEMNPNLFDSAHVQLDNIDIRQLIDLVEKTICCLGQTNVTINYQRRTSALVKATRDPSKAKSMLRDKHGILAKREDLMIQALSTFLLMDRRCPFKIEITNGSIFLIESALCFGIG
jgi:hypothetical protein